MNCSIVRSIALLLVGLAVLGRLLLVEANLPDLGDPLASVARCFPRCRTEGNDWDEDEDPGKVVNSGPRAPRFRMPSPRCMKEGTTSSGQCRNRSCDERRLRCRLRNVEGRRRFSPCHGSFE